MIFDLVNLFSTKSHKIKLRLWFKDPLTHAKLKASFYENIKVKL